jgi:hypothetical protein
VWERLAKIDRRWIFLCLLLAVAFPLFKPIGLPVGASQDAQNFYNAIENLPEGSVIMLSFSYGPTTLPENHPMAKAVIRHAFRRNLKIISFALWPDATTYSIDLVKSEADRMGKVYGLDYVTLGYMPGVYAVILQLGEDISKAFPEDANKKATSEIPLVRETGKLENVGLVVDFAAGATPDTWVAFGNARYGVKLSAGVTAVMAANFYPYLQTKQLQGMLAGLKGAAEYQKLVFGQNDEEMKRLMDAQSLGHLVIIFFVILGNIGYFMQKARSKTTI